MLQPILGFDPSVVRVQKNLTILFSWYRVVMHQLSSLNNIVIYFSRDEEIRWEGWIFHARSPHLKFCIIGHANRRAFYQSACSLRQLPPHLICCKHWCAKPRACHDKRTASFKFRAVRMKNLSAVEKKSSFKISDYVRMFATWWSGWGWCSVVRVRDLTRSSS